MKVPYDILKRFADGTILWMEAVENLKQADTRIKELAHSSPGEYCIFDQNSQSMIAAVPSKKRPALRARRGVGPPNVRVPLNANLDL